MSQTKETLILTPTELCGEGIRGRQPPGARVLIIDPKVLFTQNPWRLLGGEKTKGYLKRLHEDGVELCIAMHGSKADAEEIQGQLIDLGISHQFKFIVHEEPPPLENNIIGAIQYAYSHDHQSYSPHPTTLVHIVTDTPKTKTDHDFDDEEIDRGPVVHTLRFTQKNASNIETNLAVAFQEISDKLNIYLNTNPDNVVIEYKRDLLTWLLTTKYPMVLYHFIQFLNDKLSGRYTSPTTTHYDFFSYFAKHFFKTTFVIDGYDPIAYQITSADGKTAYLNFSSVPWWVWILVFFGVPSRPETIKNGNPVFTIMQILRSYVGGWNDVKETFTNTLGDPSFYQYRWTEKKVWQYVFLLFKLTIVLPLKVLSMPLKFLMNVIKLFTEFLLPFLTLLPLFLIANLVHLTEFSVVNFKPSRFYLIFPIIILSAISLVLTVVHYGMVLLCRVALAFSSPAQSAYDAFDLGKSLTIGTGTIRNVISYVMGGLGFMVSLGFSALLWSLALPLIVGGIVTVYPPVLSAIQWVMQLPVVSTSLAWLSHFPTISTSLTGLNHFFGLVGNALVATFGPVINFAATLFSVQISAGVLTLGSAIGMLITPVVAVGAIVGNYLSDRCAKWVESGPITYLRTCSSPSSNDEQQYRPLVESVELTSVKTDDNSESSEQKSEKAKSRPYVSVYQASAGDKFIVSKEPLLLKSLSDEFLQSVELSGKEAEKMWHRANTGDKARLPSDEELMSTEENPFVVQPAR